MKASKPALRLGITPGIRAVSVLALAALAGCTAEVSGKDPVKNPGSAGGSGAGSGGSGAMVGPADCEGNEIAMPKLGTMKGKTTFRYVGPDKVGDRQTAKIEVTTDSSLEINLEMDGTKVTGKISTNSASGTLQFDVASGRMISNQSTVSMGGTLNVNVNGMDIPIQNDQTMKTAVEYLEKLPD